MIEFHTNTLEFLTILQVANLLQIKESHIRKMIFLKQIPYSKIGRLVRFESSEIEAWLKEKRINNADKTSK